MTDPLARLSGALADRYTIERELGAGGMATVYLAHDLSGAPDFATGARHELFSTRSFLIQPFHQGLAVTPDDRAFIMLQPAGTSAGQASHLTVVLNWFAEVRAKLAGAGR